MFQDFFRFSRRPFSAAPDPDLYFPAASIEQARLTLTRCIDRGTGPGLVVAPAGLGKSLLCQVLVRQFAERFSIATLSSARLCTRRALLQAILFELGLPFRDMEEGELRLSLIDHVAPSERCANGMLLFVDEAHTLPLRLLEEIRMITNLVRDGQPRVRVVLAGNGALEERFGSPKLVSFNQRIAARCYLQPLTRIETGDFVNTQLAAAGEPSCDVFTEEAMAAMHRLTDGIPRLVNQVADHALMLAAAGDQRHIDAPGIEEAWIDLQQLPTPFTSTVTEDSGQVETNVVEFGSLADEQDEAFVDATPNEGAATFDPTATLDEIEQRVAQTHEELSPPAWTCPDPEDGQFDPTEDVRPEVELVFHEAEDPFAEEFEEEEIVDQRTIPFRGRESDEPATHEHEGLPIKMGVGDAVPGRPNLVVVGQADDARAEKVVTHFHQQARGAEVDQTASGGGPAPADDRDIIVIEDRPERNDQKAATSRPRRENYRRLFARLRQRQA
jgi:type II secretory pathway predicted ATPase ExeA